eukprot:TRINITY_DN2528_c0_g2_i1.p1 TRINITY_DN2528_c0_g2~~TRINITY_DN2528_c0_g2_i1.p1  ORF type:complete len:323 (-),score=73.07 TRINITY_DN2528_c0_g2_i1:315-1283(-)
MGALNGLDDDPQEGIRIKIMSFFRDPSIPKKSSNAPLFSRMHHLHHQITPPPRARLPSISESNQEDCTDIVEQLLGDIVSVTGIVTANYTNCSSIHVGDSYFVYPVKNMTCLESINVRDLESLFLFSDAPYNMMARIPLYGFPALNIVERLGTYNSNSKVFILGDHNYVWWIMNLLRAFDTHRCKPFREHIIIATSKDNDLSTIKTDFPDVEVIQWNDDAYEEVLLDRTHDAVKGQADVVVNCQSNPRHLTRICKVCKKDGDILIGCSLSAFAQKKLLKESRTIHFCHQSEEDQQDPEYAYLQSEKICDLVTSMKIEPSGVC